MFYELCLNYFISTATLRGKFYDSDFKGEDTEAAKKVVEPGFEARQTSEPPS